ncbi:MAG: 16S rRNA (uracil(1498)-N(3))-methyltransferase [Opitutales bacterium]|nr:16S rRNA (uracil(1498)-N(3))-methyltransferase [Opitutales bacterium]
MKHARQQPWVYVEELRSVASVLPLPTDEAQHVVRVLRCRSGDKITAFDGFGHTRGGHLKIEKKDVSLHFTEPLQPTPQPTRQFQLLLCLPNHVATFEEILRKTCELGIQSIRPLFSERTERLHWSPDVWEQRSERWRRILIEACKQAKNCFLPQLHAPFSLKELQTLPLGYCIHGSLDTASSPLPSSTQNTSLFETFSPAPSETLFSCLIGPEGGFSDTEEAFLSKISRGIHLPTCVLRTETAVVSLVAVLKVWGGNVR